MSPILTTTELKGMPMADLQKEIRAQRSLVQKMRMQIAMNTEKDSAKYKREKKALARMMTFLTQKAKGTETLNPKPKAAKLPARKTSKKSS